jgi:hypothetical protein
MTRKREIRLTIKVKERKEYFRVRKNILLLTFREKYYDYGYWFLIDGKIANFDDTCSEVKGKELVLIKL